MELFEKIKQHELNSYRLYANRIPTTFGCLYYNSDNPESYDSNHAHITIWDNPEEALELVEVFYLSKGIFPRVYGHSISDLEKLRPHLDKRGFQVSSEAFTLMILEPDKTTPKSSDSVITVRQVYDVETVAPIFRAVDKGDWNIKVTKYALSSKKYALFAAFEGEKAVSIAALQTDPELGIGLVNNVITHPDFRGRGFCTRVMDELVSYNQTHEAYPLYLFTMNPAAEKIYQKVGFTPVHYPDFAPFSAWKEIAIQL